jgi:ribulose-phosphate 3-epimerase
LEDAGVGLVHVDLIDGHFAARLGFPIELLTLAKQNSHIPLDVHLLLENPMDYAKLLPIGPGDQVTFHIETVGDTNVERTIESFRSTGARVGIALCSDTNLERVIPWLNGVDVVLLLNIPPGSHGLPPHPDAFSRLRRLAAARPLCSPNLLLEVDGGVNRSTLHRFISCSADIIVCGATLLAPDFAGSLTELRELIEGD